MAKKLCTSGHTDFQTYFELMFFELAFFGIVMKF